MHPCLDHMDACDHCYSCEVLGVCCRGRSHSSSSVDVTSQLDAPDLTAAWRSDQRQTSSLGRALEAERSAPVAGRVSVPFPEPLALTAGTEAVDPLSARLSAVMAAEKSLNPTNTNTNTNKENSNG